MIDHDDASDTLDTTLLTAPGGRIGAIWILIGLVFSIVLYLIASSNETECQTRTCPPGHTVRLQNHECQCVVPAKGTSHAR